MATGSDILAAVVQKAQKGDTNAYGILYELHAKPLYNLCIRMAGDVENARDILQESFVVGFQNLQQLKEPARFSGWLKKIVIHQCIKYSKSKFQNKELTLNEEEIEADPGESWYHEVSMGEIEKAIERLPEGYRQVFTLYAVEDYTHKEIAALMQITESTSKSQYHRARLLLKKLLVKPYVL